MDVENFDYDLPDGAIAQRPAEPRDSARLLDATGRGAVHRRVNELDRLVRPGDVVVVNDTRVMAARLELRKATGGAAEVLLLSQAAQPGQWEALVRPGRRLAPGTALYAKNADDACEPLAEVGEVLSDGRRLVTVADGAVEAVGTMPLPPYINETIANPDRYQTVFARNPASVAAPTAGLHLTEELLARMEQAGAEVVTVELQVGLGTFRPITVGNVEDHVMHTERYVVAPEAWRKIGGASRVLAVGTTVVRTLESVAASALDGDVKLSGSTDLFIRRGYRWQVVDVLLTNFHVPRSSLLVLVDAFVGERWRDLYQSALAADYRFLSFGDAMLLARQDGDAASGPYTATSTPDDKD